MPRVQIDIGKLPDFIGGTAKRMQRAVRRGVVSGAARCVPYLVERGDTAAPASVNGSRGAFNTGNYRRRWRMRALTDGAVVFNDATYAGVIEKGRRPGKFPDISAVRAWARRKLHLSPKEAKRAAYPIARAIARRGLRARVVMTPKSVQQAMTKIVVDEVRREIREELRK